MERCDHACTICMEKFYSLEQKEQHEQMAHNNQPNQNETDHILIDDGADDNNDDIGGNPADLNEAFTHIIQCPHCERRFPCPPNAHA